MANQPTTILEEVRMLRAINKMFEERSALLEERLLAGVSTPAARQGLTPEQKANLLLNRSQRLSRSNKKHLS